MSSLKYKTGDKVWVEFVVAEVDGGDRNWPYRIQSDDGEDYWMSEAVVRDHPQAANISVDDVQVEDVITDQGNFYTVDLVMDDRVFLKENGGYLMKEDIEAIYRSVYTKKKCVEDMTREELLEYVKQLEGGVNG